ncbi:MAG: Response regulatory protein [Fibrobacteres bacterium]|nr:Response regulatory protein [Fibrobacterota bacterium]
MHRLRIFEAGSVKSIPLADSVLTAGTAPDNEIVLTGSDIPPIALRLSLTGDGYSVSVAGPKAKPSLNGERSEHFRFRPGDLLEIGSARLLLELDAAPAMQGDAVSRGFSASLSKLCALVAEERDLKTLLTRVMGLLLESFGGTEALLFTVDEAMKPAVAVSTREGGAGPLFSDTVVEKVLRSGKGMFLGNALEDPEYANSQSVVDLRLHSVLCGPIFTAGRLSGLIYIGSNLPSVSYGEGQLRELEIHALVAGCLINHIGYIEMQGRMLRSLRPEEGGPGFIATCPAMQNALREARAVASADIAVLLEGETGTGKDVFANHIHRVGRRAAKPFMVVNCGTLRGELLASELFGHKKGAFTGALQDKRGIFQEADGGTLFLDEIGEMDLPLQAMLLRTLETGMVRPVGQSHEVKVNVRLICATNRRLEEMVANGSFRQDLYYRVNQHGITLPPLRERGEDVLLLAHFYLEKAKAQYPEKNLAGFLPESLFAMARYRWPGNVRELANAVAKAALFAESPVVKVLLPGNKDRWMDMDEATRRFQADYLQRALDLSGGDKDKAAEMLGMGRSTFFRHLAQARGESPAPK